MFNVLTLTAFLHKQMLDVRHDNLAHFIGATVDPPNVCVVSEFYPRGSLQVSFSLAIVNAFPSTLRLLNTVILVDSACK